MNHTNGNQVLTFGPFAIDLVEKMLSCDGKPVAIAPKLFNTLAILVENAGHVVEKGPLMDRVWNETFVEESSLSQNIFQLRKILANRDSDTDYIETIPKRGYRFAARVVNGSESAAVEPSPAMIHEDATSRPRLFSIVVMPFAVIGETGPDEELLGIGMADALVLRLSALEDVATMPTRTMLKYAGRLEDLKAAARDLGVSAVLEGTVQRSRGRIRVNAQLLDAASGKCRWSGAVDDRFTDIFTVQDRIADEISRAVESELCLKPHVSGRIDALDNVGRQDWLMGVYFANKRTAEALAKSIEFFLAAIKKSPNYAPAHAGLADSYFWLAYSHDSLDFRCDSFEKSREHALIAIKLDPFVAEAHAALATVKIKHDHDAAAAEDSFRRAIAVNPKCSMAYSRYTYFLAAAGRLDEALRTSQRAQELDPLSADVNAGLAMVLYFQRRYDEAIRYCWVALTLEPSLAEAALLLGRCFEQQGLFVEAEAEYADAARMEPGCREADELRAHLHALTGRKSLAEQELSKLSASGLAKPYNIAAIYSALGDDERASAWLRRPFINWTERLRMLRYDPRLDGCRPPIESV